MKTLKLGDRVVFHPSSCAGPCGPSLYGTVIEEEHISRNFILTGIPVITIKWDDGVMSENEICNERLQSNKD